MTLLEEIEKEVADWAKIGQTSWPITLLARCAKEIRELRGASEELRDACCTAVNWEHVMNVKIGDAPWVSEDDARDVYNAVRSLNEALARVGNSHNGREGK